MGPAPTPSTDTGDAPQFLIEISRDSAKIRRDLATVANEVGLPELLLAGHRPLTSAAKFRITAAGDPEATEINDTDIRLANVTGEILTPETTWVALARS